MRAVLVGTWRSVRPDHEPTCHEYLHELEDYWTQAGLGARRSRPGAWLTVDGTSHWFIEGELTDLLLLTSTSRARWLAMKASLAMNGFEERLYLTGTRMRRRPLSRLLREHHLI